MRRQDNQLQRMVTDANKAGISISTALGAQQQAPVQVSIPGHGTRRAGTAAQRANVDMGDVTMRTQIRNAQQIQLDTNMVNKSKADADTAFYDMLLKKQEWEKSRNPSVPELPNRHYLYYDNTKEAIEHYNSGGYVRPAGAELEMPFIETYYETFNPRLRPSERDLKYDAEQYYYNNGLGIAP